MTDERDARFLISIFKKYYYDYISSIPAPDRILHREFGYQKFDTPGMIRHIQIKDAAEMRVTLLRNAPSDVYCSNACYAFPNLEMAQKGWQGADLIFDIDAKDLELPCRSGHVVYVCVKCNKACSRDAPSDAAHKHNNEKKDASLSDPTYMCSACGDTSNIRPRSLSCKKCIAASKVEVRRLIDTLRGDLGISEDGISTYFSGNAGFHVHVACDAFFELDSRARADLTDYITLRGLIPEALGMKKGGPDAENFVSIDEGGWRGMLAKSMFGSKSKRVETIKELAKIPDAGYARFRDMMNDAISEIGIKIDSAVTTDVHRVFRMPCTLNSKSGMLKAPCPDGVDKFDPYTDAVALSIYDDNISAVSVVADCPVKFEMCGKRYGPYNNEHVDLPTSVAVYLICKDFARYDEAP